MMYLCIFHIKSRVRVHARVSIQCLGSATISVNFQHKWLLPCCGVKIEDEADYKKC